MKCKISADELMHIFMKDDTSVNINQEFLKND